MTDAEIDRFLADEGYPEHVRQQGRHGLIARWQRFVSDVERGWTLGIEDYWNELDIRDLIARLGLASEVADADARMRALLVGPELVHWESETPDAFWIRGYPRNASPEFVEELRANCPFAAESRKPE